MHARIAALEAEIVRLAAPIPGYALLKSLLGVGTTFAGVLLAEIGGIT